MKGALSVSSFWHVDLIVELYSTFSTSWYSISINVFIDFGCYSLCFIIIYGEVFTLLKNDSQRKIYLFCLKKMQYIDH